MPTASTLPLILLIALLWKLTKGHVLSIVLYTSVFEAASAINLGQLGIATWIFALGFCFAVKLVQGHRRLRLGAGINRASFGLLALFMLYAMFSGMVNPFLFEGITVLHSGAPIKLAWGMFNVAQLCYLLAAFAVYILAVTSTREELRMAVRWFSYGCVTAAVVTMYQLANAVAHIPYPAIVLYTNPSHVIYHAYQIGGMWRLNGPFPEASSLATLMIVGIALLAWDLATRPLRWGSMVALGLEVLSLLFTQSSQGYASLVVLGLLGGWLLFGYVIRSRGLSHMRVLLGCLALCSALAVCVLTDVPKIVQKVVNSTLLEKASSASYKERKEWNDSALRSAKETYYMGAGWGSIRASGLVYVLLGTTGLIGLSIFACFYASLFLPMLKPRPPSVGGVRDDLYEKSLLATTMMLVGLSIAGAEPVQPVLWALFGVVTMGRPSWAEIAGVARLGPQALSWDRQYV